MKQRKRIPARRRKPRVIHPERSGGHLRVRLYGKAKTARRQELFRRSGGRCEAQVFKYFDFAPPGYIRCWRSITWASMEWSHNRHGANKCDCMDCGIASCKECHERRHRPKGLS